MDSIRAFFWMARSQAFVGSACTLEILDEDGNLVKRLPVFWGPGSRFALIDGPEGSIDLLIARQPTDSHAMAVVNNREMDPKQRSLPRRAGRTLEYRRVGVHEPEAHLLMRTWMGTAGRKWSARSTGPGTG